MKQKLVKLPVITDSVARQVWMLPLLQDKKDFLLDYMGAEYNTPEQQKIRQKINNTKSGSAIDTLVSNMMLKTEGKGING